jgi:hypothetical protein
VAETPTPPVVPPHADYADSEVETLPEYAPEVEGKHEK